MRPRQWKTVNSSSITGSLEAATETNADGELSCEVCCTSSCSMQSVADGDQSITCLQLVPTNLRTFHKGTQSVWRLQLLNPLYYTVVKLPYTRVSITQFILKSRRNFDPVLPKHVIPWIILVHANQRSLSRKL